MSNYDFGRSPVFPEAGEQLEIVLHDEYRPPKGVIISTVPGEMFEEKKSEHPQPRVWDPRKLH